MPASGIVAPTSVRPSVMKATSAVCALTGVTIAHQGRAGAVPLATTGEFVLTPSSVPTFDAARAVPVGDPSGVMTRAVTGA